MAFEIPEDSGLEIIRRSAEEVNASPKAFRLRTSSSIDASIGETVPIRATATTTWTAYPTVAGNKIQEFEIEIDIDNPSSRRVWVALSDGATNYTVLATGDSFYFKPKNATQIFIRTAASTATFSMWANR